MVIVIALRIGAVVVLLADIKLAAQNRLNSPLLRRLKKMNRAVDIAVVGNRNRLLPNLGNMVDQPLNVAGAVQKGVIRMQMKMSEFGHCAALILERHQQVFTTPKPHSQGKLRKTRTQPASHTANEAKLSYRTEPILRIVISIGAERSAVATITSKGTKLRDLRTITSLEKSKNNPAHRPW
jgi:hypothetical protein